MVKKTEDVSSISKEMKVSNKEVHQYSSPAIPRRAMFEVQKQLAINTGKTRNTASGNLMETLGKERYTRGTPMSCAQQCYAMVGLPARGKSYIAHRLARYLNWIGIKSKVFNVGSVRRELVGVNMPCDYYDPNNTTGAQSRRMVASHVLDTIVEWFKVDPDNSVAVGGVEKSCTNNRLILAQTQMRQTTGGALDVTGLNLRESITVQCNHDDKVKTFINKIRRIEGVVVESIDYHNPDRGNNTGNGMLSIKCTTDGFFPDIFTDIITWCALGCTPIPEDARYYWYVSYSPSTVSVLESETPITFDLDRTANITCQDGYAVPYGNTGYTQTRCTETGWHPGYTELVHCVPGCKDITGDIKKGITEQAPYLTATSSRPAAGRPPFVSGDVIEWSCLQGFALVGSSATTCNAAQVWTDPAPLCVGSAAVILTILDATNTTRDRRDLILEKITPEGIQVLFIESVLDDVQIEEMNIREHKVRCPDYQGCDPDAAFKDFSERIQNYKKAYEALCLNLDRELSFIRVSNITQFHINNLASTVQSKSAYFLMNIRPHTKTTLYLSRHGESQFNAEAKIGGDTNLTENGIKYAKKLGKFVQENNLTDVPVWTSIMKRTIETCSHLPNQNVQRYKSLNEIDAGRCDGLTYEQIEDLYPEEFALRDLDKYNYRYPQGESYQDICCRLEPIIMDLEKQDQILVICHQAVLRCVVGYFLNLSTEEIPYIKIPLHTVIKITPVAYGCEKEEITFGVDSSVNTHRAQPTQESIEQRLLALDVPIGDSGDICNSDSPVISVNGNHSDLRT